MARSSPKISVIVTVLNEAKTIDVLLNSLLVQTRVPDEVIIVDGGSTDNTLQLIKAWHNKYAHLTLRVYTKKANRAVGRNYAIKKAEHNWIAITDAGCKPKKNWLEELEKTAIQTGNSVIAGYYDAQPRNALSSAIIPYILVMPNKINNQLFLPATRSMMIHRKVWEKVGMFDESLDSSEDYVFAKKIELRGFTIAFTAKAVVSWMPMTTLHQFAKYSGWCGLS